MRTMPLALLAAALLAGCAPRDPPPDAVYRAFARATADHDAEAAWALLSASTRRWLEAGAAAAAARAPGVVAAAGPRLLLGDAASGVRPVKEIEILRQDGEQALLRVVDAGGAAAQVTLVREGGGWRLEIPPPPG